MVRGIRDDREKTVYLYNIKDHQECYREVQSQGIFYTTGVPAMISAKLMLQGEWFKSGVWNIEQMNPDPFMQAMNDYGLPWKIVENPQLNLL